MAKTLSPSCRHFPDAGCCLIQFFGLQGREPLLLEQTVIEIPSSMIKRYCRFSEGSHPGSFISVTDSLDGSIRVRKVWARSRLSAVHSLRGPTGSDERPAPGRGQQQSPAASSEKRVACDHIAHARRDFSGGFQ